MSPHITGLLATVIAQVCGHSWTLWAYYEWLSLLNVIGLSDFIGFIDCLSSIYRPSPRALDGVTEGQY